MLIQRIGIHKWSAAGRAEGGRLKWLRQEKAGGTDWNRGYVSEWLFAEPAFVRKDEIEDRA